MLPHGSVHLAALMSRLPSNCVRVHRVSLHPQVGRRNLAHELMSPLAQQRLRGFHGGLHHRVDIEQLQLPLGLAGGDARDVEQVVDQARTCNGAVQLARTCSPELTRCSVVWFRSPLRQSETQCPLRRQALSP